MQAFFSSEGSVALQFLVIFLIILALFLIAALLFVRLSGRGLTIAARPGQRGRQPRLGIVDIYELDRQRQLILLRRDNVEHLLLVGGPNDVVVERHIQRGAGARYAPEGGTSAEDGSAADAAPEPPRIDPFLDSPKPPTFAMPEIVPAPGPGLQPHAERAPPLDSGLFEPEEPEVETKPRAASPVSRLMRRTLPPLVTPRPEPASERAARPEEAAPSAAPPPAEPPPVMAARGPRSVDPAVLSDMARQLQVALKRPSSAVTPPPTAAAAAVSPAAADAPPVEAPAPIEAPAAARPDPIAQAMAAPPFPPPPPRAAAPAQPAPSPVASDPVKPEPVPVPAPVPLPKPAPLPPAEKPAVARPEPAPRSEPAKPDPVRPEPAKPDTPEAPQGQNPFSVEEIEAEFARLLGRPLDSKS
ncbi:MULTISPECIES: hypothetical protein [unclassified Methylobacterium]|uniref:hypothetical protein n=1 Tax=unclassified Methylobacterium TaxID=2615210 RepID=UPI0036F69739